MISDDLFNQIQQAMPPPSAESSTPASTTPAPNDLRAFKGGTASRDEMWDGTQLRRLVLGSPSATPAGSLADVANSVSNAFKGGVASGAELANVGARLGLYVLDPFGKFGLNPYGPDTTTGKTLAPGAAERAIGYAKDLKSGNAAVDTLINPMAKGVGNMVSMPIPGMSIAKNVAAGAGMGELGQLGRMIFGGVADWFGASPQTQKAIADTGEMLGAAAGVNANVIRFNTIGETMKFLAKNATTAASSVAPAYQAAKAAQVAGDERRLWPIFTENMGDLRAKAMNLLQDRTNETLANVIRRDPDADQYTQQFVNAAKNLDVPLTVPTQTGGERNLFTLGQQTANPRLANVESKMSRLNTEQAAEFGEIKQAQQGELTAAYKRVANNPFPTDQKSLAQSLTAYQAESVSKVQDLAANATQVKNTVENWTASEQAMRGAGLRTLFDSEIGTARSMRDQKYEGVFDLATANKVTFDMSPLLRDTKAVLEPLLADVDKSTVPQSIRNLDALLKRGQESEQAGKEALELNAVNPFYLRSSAGQVDKAKTVSLRELNDVAKSLSADAERAFKQPGADGHAMGTNLNTIGAGILDIINKQSPPAVAQAFEDARAWYRDNYAPRFRTGVNFNLDRQASIANRGRERVTDENVWGQYLKKGDMADRMNQFDALFGGSLAPRNRAAYIELGDALENRYQDEVLAGKFSPERHDQFVKDYSAALERVPATADKLNETAKSLDLIDSGQQRIRDMYKDVLGGSLPTLASKIGPMQARQLFMQALADPTKMEKLLASPAGNTPDRARALAKEVFLHADPLKTGTWDAGAVNDMLTAGAGRSGQPGSLQLLFEKAFGTEAGAAHMQRLRELNVLMGREAMVDPKYLRFDDKSGSPVKDATGSSVASLLSGIRNWNMFGGYFAFATGGRFINTTVQRALVDAQLNAMYDPAMSKAVLELARTPDGGHASLGLLAKVFGPKTGRFLHDKILEKHTAGAQFARGALGGYQLSQQEQPEAQRPMPAFR